MNAPQHRRTLRPALAACMAATLSTAWLPAWSQAQAPAAWQEPVGWYGTVALGQALSVGDTTANVNLGGSPVNVSLDGKLHHDGGSVGGGGDLAVINDSRAANGGQVLAVQIRGIEGSHGG